MALPLSTALRRSLRIGPPNHFRDALRMADPLRAFLVGQPDDLRHPRAPDLRNSKGSRLRAFVVFE